MWIGWCPGWIVRQRLAVSQTVACLPEMVTGVRWLAGYDWLLSLGPYWQHARLCACGRLVAQALETWRTEATGHLPNIDWITEQVDSSTEDPISFWGNNGGLTARSGSKPMASPRAALEPPPRRARMPLRPCHRLTIAPPSKHRRPLFVVDSVPSVVTHRDCGSGGKRPPGQIGEMQ